jgi:hypothetical protein
MNTNSVNVVVKDKANGDDADTIQGAENDVQIVRQRDHRASIDVPSALALAEHFEQTRCKVWNKLLLRQPDHPLALVSSDEYATQLQVEKVDDSKTCSKSKSEDACMMSTNNKNIRLLVERGLDRLWLARLLENASATSVNSSPMKWSKDDLMHFKCEKVLSVSTAIASLQRR